MADDKDSGHCVLKLRYPSGRSYTYIPEDPMPINVGDQCELFGRRWQVSRLIRDLSKRLEATSAEPPVYECRPISGMAPSITPSDRTRR